ncbi:MAG: hypothetical protein WC357_07835, partial [Candidatus Omnitrophota bacterium]
FQRYIEDKERACSELRGQGKKKNPEFLFLDIKLNAIEKIIAQELGRRGLERIKALYEFEMIDRILKNTEH